MRAIGEWWRWFLHGGWRWAILAVLIVAFLWFVPQLQGEYFSHKVPAKERPALVNEYRRTWAQIVGGFGLLLGLYFTWRRIEISQRELEATRDQQVTERFTRAIDQLGAFDDDGVPRLEIRLGGIYALERIAGDSLAMENYPGRDYATVMEVLSAYVRENTLRAPGRSKESTDAASMSNGAFANADEGAEQPARSEAVRSTADRPTADIQAILDVLGRAQTRAPEEYHTRLDLHEAKLPRADLRAADLRRANLQEANLQRAYLQRANLRRANLQEANLRGANLRAADLQEAYLQEADLEGVDLGAANLQEADLQEANLQRANLQRANLQGADLPQADFQGAQLQVANLQEANLRGANLRGANLQVANLQGADLPQADLQGADLQRANLQEAYLEGANLQGADLFGANLQGALHLTREQIEWTIGSEKIPLTEGLYPPELWSKSIEEQIQIVQEHLEGTD